MKILIVIVLYKCRLKDSVSFRCLVEQVKIKRADCAFFVYDNSPLKDSEGESFLMGYKDSCYIHNEKNPGLSKAYNEAAVYAGKCGYEWLLLLDQDTTLPSDMLGKYIAAIESNQDITLFAPQVKIFNNRYISPCKIRMKNGSMTKKPFKGRIKNKNLSVINSGLLISVNAFEACGGYNEKVYLDYNDHEFFSRYKKIYPWFYVVDVELVQDFACVSKDEQTLLHRYEVLCDCVSNVVATSFMDRTLYNLMLFRRAVHLFLITHKTVVFRIFYKYKM